MMTATPPRPLKVFISYAHEDDTLCEEFVKYLSQLRHDSLIEDWHDRRLTGGSEWEGQIDEHLDTADIVVLLVSQDFLNSRYCYDVEMKRALDRHKQRKTRVVPVIRANLSMASLSCVPRPAGENAPALQVCESAFTSTVPGSA